MNFIIDKLLKIKEANNCPPNYEDMSREELIEELKKK